MPYSTTEGLRLASPAALGGLLRAVAPRALRAARQRPPVLAIGLVAAVAASFARLQQGGHLPLLEFLREAFFPRALVYGEWGRIATATLLCRDVFMCVSICVSLLVAFGAYEVLAGHLRAAVVLAGGAVLGPASVTAGLGLLQAVGVGWAAQPMGTVDIGASAVVAAASGAIAGVVRRRPLTLALVAFVAGGALVHHQLADWEHVLVLPAGYGWGRLTGVAPAPLTSRPARKRLVASWRWVAAASAVAVAAPISATLLPAPAAPWFGSAAGISSRAPQAAAHPPSSTAVSPARLITTTFPAPALGGRRDVLVLLPAGYDSGPASYPVVVFLHGDPGAPRDLISAADIPAAAQRPDVAPFIAVMPDGRGPLVKASWYVNLPGQRMGTALTRDLRAWVTTTFRTDGRYSYAGLSSGGYGAAYLAMTDALPVHAECGLSGRYDAAIPPLSSATAAQRAADSPIAHPRLAPPFTFLAYGSGDRNTSGPARLYAAALHAANRRVVVRAYPGAHTWNVWRAGFADCLAAILPAANANARPAAAPLGTDGRRGATGPRTG